MQVTEKTSEGLLREFEVQIPLSDLDMLLTARLSEMAPRVQMKGFRPGKVPVSFLRKAYGKPLMSEIVEKTVNETSEKVLKERALKPAGAPRVNFLNTIDAVIEGKSDLEFSLAVDLMPEFEMADFGMMEVERLVSEVDEKEVDEALKRIAASQRVFEAKPEGAAAEKGDFVTIDFEGKIDGVPFDGGKAADFDLGLGSGSFIPGFEDQLVGAKVGDSRVVNVTFPENYGAPELAGKPAAFDVQVKAVKAASEVAIDDELAKKVGLDSLDVLKTRIRDQIKSEHSKASRMHLKRRILDALDKAHPFDLPQAMVKQEFEGIWKQVQDALQKDNKKPEDEGTTEEELRKEYMEIAERRVRLGLVLTKVGELNGLTIGQDEINRALAERVRGLGSQQQQQVIQYYTNNPQALAQLRAPLFEDKVVDFVSELIKIKDHSVARDVLFLDPDEAAEKLKAEEPEAKTQKPKGKAKKKD